MPQQWPWSKADRDWFAARLREKQDVPDALSRRFLRQLALGLLNPQPECRVAVCRRGEPVRNLRAWFGMHDAEALAGHVRTADDESYAAAQRFADRVHDWVVRWVGWRYERRKRGDVIRSWRKARWLGMRTK